MSSLPPMRRMASRPGPRGVKPPPPPRLDVARCRDCQLEVAAILVDGQRPCQRCGSLRFQKEVPLAERLAAADLRREKQKRRSAAAG